MGSRDPGGPAGGILEGSAESPGTGAIPISDKNPDEPEIGSLGGFTPNFPDEEAGRNATYIEPRRPDEPILDETDEEYLEMPEEKANPC